MLAMEGLQVFVGIPGNEGHFEEEEGMALEEG